MPGAGLSSQIEVLLRRSEAAARYLVFAPPFAGHPLADAEQVFTTAVEDLGEDATLVGQTPLLFVGLQARNFFLSRVESVGFLLTEESLYVRESPSTPQGPAPVRALELDDFASAQALLRAAAATFDRRWALRLTDPETLDAALQLLRQAIELALQSREG